MSAMDNISWSAVSVLLLKKKKKVFFNCVMNNQSYNFNYFSLSADIYIFSVLRHFSPAFIDLLVSYNQHIRTKLMQLIKKNISNRQNLVVNTPSSKKSQETL